MTSLRPPRRPLSHPGAEHVVVWLPDGWMVRVFHAHPDPARAPTRPRTFGPIGRFDPHVRDARQKPREQPDGRGVIYLGDTLAAGLAESFPDQWPDVLICPNQRAVQAAPQVPVELIDLTGDGAMAIGAVGTLGSGNEPRRLTQRWGRAIYEDFVDLSGVMYRGAHQGGECVTVWERAGELRVRPGLPADGEVLAGTLAKWVTVALGWQGRRPVWIEAADCPKCREAGLA